MYIYPITGSKTGIWSNVYKKVFNSLGQQVYKAKEDSDCCTRQCCGPARCFDLNITDMQVSKQKSSNGG